jgi:hypothetical protein
MTEVQERIYSAAIWYKDLAVPDWVELLNAPDMRGIVIKGHRHADIIYTVYTLIGKRTCSNGSDCTGESEQGFVTNKGRFVNRQEAMHIARAAGQVISDNTSDQLYSEDLY